MTSEILVKIRQMQLKAEKIYDENVSLYHNIPEKYRHDNYWENDSLALELCVEFDKLAELLEKEQINKFFEYNKGMFCKLCQKKFGRNL